MAQEIKKAIIPMAGFGTRFLPMSKILPKELLPLADLPMFTYNVREAKEAGIKQVIFVLQENKKMVLDYFKGKCKAEDILKERGQNERLEKLKKIEEDFNGLSFAYAVQKIPNGDGDAVLKAQKQVGKSPFGVLFVDDIFECKEPAISQLANVFATSQKMVIGLKKIPAEKLSSYGVVKVEKIANRIYKIKDIAEKPKPGEAPSDLAICGRYLLTPEIFGYLAKTEPTSKGEVILANAFKKMLEDGKIIYGCEIEGEWLECGKTADWLRSHLYLSLRHPEYGPMLREWAKKDL